MSGWHRRGANDSKRLRGSAGVKDRARILWQEPMCRVCDKAASVQVDHITPLSKGGTDDRDNKQGICKPCHDAKTAREGGYETRPKVTIGVDGWPIGLT